MKKFVYLALFGAFAVSAQSASLWYQDFSNSNDVPLDATGRLFPPATPGTDQLATNSVYEGTWYRRANEAWATMFANTTAEKNGKSFACPQDAVGGVALRPGYHGHTDTWTTYVDINPGLKLDTTNLIYTLSFSAKVQHRLDASTNLFGTGSVQASWGWWDSTAPSNNFKWFASGQNFSNLTSTAWVTNSIQFVGARVNAAAASSPLVVRFTKKGPQNTTDFETWIDWVNIDGEDRYADWAASEGLTGVRTDDKDGDDIDDFTEWATGGNPNDSNDTGLAGACFMVDESGTNRFAYVTPRQTNYWSNGIDYWLEGTDSLTIPAWTNMGWNAGVADSGFNAEYDAVTNYVGNIESNDTQFIRLRVGHRGYNP